MVTMSEFRKRIGQVKDALPDAALADERKHYLGAIRLRLAQFYDECPNDARLREHISDECDWLDVEIARNSAPQETRGDEPDAEDAKLAALIERQHGIKIVGSLAVDSGWAKSLILAALRRGRGSSQAGEYLRGYAIGLHDGSVASQQSPRLEREGIARIIDPGAWELKDIGYTLPKFAVEKSLSKADAILALLSPDTTVVTSTERADG